MVLPLCSKCSALSCFCEQQLVPVSQKGRERGESAKAWGVGDSAIIHDFERLIDRSSKVD